jgi:4-aminobutyrate aminotransferase-like enzyme
MDKVIEQILNFKQSNLPEYERYLMWQGGWFGPHLVKGKGIYVEDIDGKKYLDCTSMAWVLLLGYSHPEVNQVVKEQLDYLTQVDPQFRSPARYILAKRVAELAPGDLNRVLFTLGGGPSIEAALKVAIVNNPDAQQFIALYYGYHGMTFQTIAATHTATMAGGSHCGSGRLSHFLHNFVRVQNPYCYRCPYKLEYKDCGILCADVLEDMIVKGISGPVAGVLLEPIQGGGGQIPLPVEYLQKVREICDKYKIILIFDEIQTCFGRTGEWFAATLFGINPDVMVLGKAFGGGFPAGAIIVSDRIKGIEDEWYDFATFANHQIAQVATLKMIEVIERDNILDNVKNVGSFISNAIKKMISEFPQIGDVRGPGLHIGVELVKDPETKEEAGEEALRFREVGRELGVIWGMGSPKHNVIKIKPPLITTIEEAEKIVELFYECMRRVFKK